MPLERAPTLDSKSGVGDKPAIEDKIGSREDRRRQLAELVGRLLARHWIDHTLRGPAPAMESSRPG
jgi:hypothetical protein